MVKLTKEACQRCLKMAKEGRLRLEMVQRLPAGAFAPLARDGSGKCCFDCGAADGMVPFLMPTFTMARVAVGADRQEQYRLPGVPMGLVLSGLVKPSAAGDLEEQHRWLKANQWFGIPEDMRCTP